MRARSNRPVILVADDYEDVLALIVFHLQRAGYEVLTATDGEEALRLAQEHEIDLAILDVMMPKLSGLEVCRRLRASESRIRTPILLLTARVRDIDVESGLDSGADEYIMKPFPPRDLQKRVAAILERPAGGFVTE